MLLIGIWPRNKSWQEGNIQGQNFPTITSWQEIKTTYFLILRFLTDLDATKDDFGGCNTYITAKFHMLKKTLLSYWKWKDSTKLLNTVWSLSSQNYPLAFIQKLMLSPGKMLKSSNHENLIFCEFSSLYDYNCIRYQILNICYKTFIFQNCNFDLGCNRWVKIFQFLKNHRRRGQDFLVKMGELSTEGWRELFFVNIFHVTGLFRYTLKTSENLWVNDVWIL